MLSRFLLSHFHLQYTELGGLKIHIIILVMLQNKPNINAMLPVLKMSIITESLTRQRTYITAQSVRFLNFRSKIKSTSKHETKF